MSVQHSQEAHVPVSGLDGDGAATQPADARPRPAFPPTAPAASPWYAEPPARLLLATIGILVLALALVAAYAKVQLDRRDATIAEYQRVAGVLTAANLTFHDEIRSLGAERQELLDTREAIAGERAEFTAQRDRLTAERDQLAAARDSFAGKVGDLEKQVAELDSALADAGRQLGQARQEGARQQNRAQSAESLSTGLAALIDLDNQIYAEYDRLLEHYTALNRSLARGDRSGAESASNQGAQTAARLKALFERRDAVVATLR